MVWKCSARGDVKAPKPSGHLWAVSWLDILKAQNACSFLNLSAPLVSVVIFLYLFFYTFGSAFLILPSGSASTILCTWLFLSVSSFDSLALIWQTSVWMNLPTPLCLTYWWYVGLIVLLNSDLYFKFLLDTFAEYLLYTGHCPRCYHYRMEQNTFKGPTVTTGRKGRPKRRSCG